MAVDETTVHTVTIMLRTRDSELAETLARDASTYAADTARHNPDIDWEIGRDRYAESRLPPIRLHDSDIGEIARRVRDEPRGEPPFVGEAGPVLTRFPPGTVVHDVTCPGAWRDARPEDCRCGAAQVSTPAPQDA